MSWPLMWALTQRFRRLVSYKYYCVLIFFPIFFLFTSHFFPLRDDFFIQFMNHEKGHRNHCLSKHACMYVTFDDGKGGGGGKVDTSMLKVMNSSISNGSTNNSNGAVSRGAAKFTSAFSKFYGQNVVKYLEPGEFEFAMSNRSENASKECPRQHFTKAEMSGNKGKNGSSRAFRFKMHQRIYADKLLLNALDTRYISQNSSYIHAERAEFVHYLWKQATKRLGLSSSLKLDKVEPMKMSIKEMMVSNLSMVLRFAPSMRALACASVKALYNMENDLTNGFISLLLSSSQRQVNLAHYIYAQFIWSLIYGLHLFWICVIIGLWILEINFLLTSSVFLGLFCGLVLLSFDLHVTAQLYLLVLRNKEVALASFALVNLMCYLVLITTVEPAIFTSSLLWYNLDQSPLLIGIFRTLSSFFPGILFEWLLIEVIYDSAPIHAQLNEKYRSPNRLGTSIGVLLVGYLVMCLLKTIACSLAYKYLWSNQPKRRVLVEICQDLKAALTIPHSVDRSKLIKDAHLKKKKDDNNNNTHSSTEASSNSSKSKKSKKSGQTLVELSHIRARYRPRRPDKVLAIASLKLESNQITGFYSAINDAHLTRTAAQLCAGQMKPDEGVVKLAVDRSQIGYITKIKQDNVIYTPREYLTLFCSMEQIPTKSRPRAIDNVCKELEIPQQFSKPSLPPPQEDGKPARKDAEKEKKVNLLENLKLSLAKALISECQVLVLDQPTRGMTEEERRDFWSLLNRIKEGRAIFVTTCSQQDVGQMDHEVHIYNDGSVFPRSSALPNCRGQDKGFAGGVPKNPKFVLNISKTSKMNLLNLRTVIQQTQKEANPKPQQLKVGAHQPPPEPPVCIFKKESIKDYVFTFHYGTAKQKQTMTQLLDSLQLRYRTGQLMINGIGMEDRIGDLLSMSNNSQPSPLSTSTSEQSKEKSASSKKNAKRAKQTGNLTLSKYDAIVRNRLSLLIDWPPWILALSIVMALFFFIQFDADFKYIMDLGRTELHVKMSELEGRSKMIFSDKPKEANSTPDYPKWVFSNTRYFYEYVQKFVYFYELQVTKKEPKLSPANGTNSITSSNKTTTGWSYVLNIYFNPHSKYSTLFLMIEPLKRILQDAVKRENIAGAKVDLDFQYTGLYRKGSNILETIFAAFVGSNLAACIMLGLFFTTQYRLVQEIRCRFLYFRQINGISYPIYIHSVLISVLLFATIGWLVTYIIEAYVIDYHGLGVVYFATTFTQFILLMARLILAVLAISGYANACATFFSIRFQAVGAFVLGIMMMLKNISYIIALSWFVMGKGAYLSVTYPLIIWPMGVFMTETEKTYFIQYDPRYNAEEYVSNFGQHYYHFWLQGEGWNLLIMAGYAILFYAICHYKDYFTLCRYRRSGRRGDKPNNPQDPKASTAAIQSNPHAHFTVHRLTIYSALARLEDISFTLNRGECLGLFSLPKAGKGYLMEVLAGFRPFDRGDFWLTADENYAQKSHVRKLGKEPCIKRLEGVALCPTFNCIQPAMRVKGALALFAQLRSTKKAQLKGEIARIARQFQLEKLLHMYGRDLDEYEARRVMLAMTFIGSPSLVLLDEPSRGVDTVRHQELWSMIQGARKQYNSTMLVATCDKQELEALCDRVGIIMRGRLTGAETAMNATPGASSTKQKTPNKGDNNPASPSLGLLITIKLRSTYLGKESYNQELEQAILAALPTSTSNIGSSIMIRRYFLANWSEQSLSNIFARLEELRKRFKLESFALSLSQLDQIFLCALKSKQEQQGQLGGQSSSSSKSSSNTSTDTLASGQKSNASGNSAGSSNSSGSLNGGTSSSNESNAK